MKLLAVHGVEPLDGDVLVEEDPLDEAELDAPPEPPPEEDEVDSELEPPPPPDELELDPPLDCELADSDEPAGFPAEPAFPFETGLPLEPPQAEKTT